MALKTYGTMAVDWEERVNFDRLRNDRLARIKKLLKESDVGALLTFDMNNIRYITATIIGTWAMDKLVRFAPLPQDDEPLPWAFGSAAEMVSGHPTTKTSSDLRADDNGRRGRRRGASGLRSGHPGA